jgi:anti-anti-sigma factor
MNTEGTSSTAVRGAAGAHGNHREGSMRHDLPKRPEEQRAAKLVEVGQLKVRSERDGVVHTIGLVGELDLATAREAERELKRVEATDASSIILDLSGLTFIESTGVRLVLSALARSRADSNRLTLLRGPGTVHASLSCAASATFCLSPTDRSD